MAKDDLDSAKSSLAPTESEMSMLKVPQRKTENKDVKTDPVSFDKYAFLHIRDDMNDVIS